MVWCVQASCVIWGLLNYAGWQLMKSQAVADAHGWSRCVASQAHDSLAGRAYEWERMPLGIDQGIGAVVWGPLGWGRLTGKLRRGQPLPQHSRLHATAAAGPAIDDARLLAIIDALDRCGNRAQRAADRHQLVVAAADREHGADWGAS